MAAETSIDRHHNGPPAAEQIEDTGPLVTTKKQRGRPSLYTPETVDRICDRLADADSLRATCRDPGMPSVRTVLSWAATRPEFRRHYDLAREMGRHAICDEVLDILNSFWQRNSPTALQDARREIDALKWKLGQMTPKRRGARPPIANAAKIAVAQGSPDPPPVKNRPVTGRESDTCQLDTRPLDQWVRSWYMGFSRA